MDSDKVIRVGEKPMSPAMQAVYDIVSHCMQCGTCSGSCPTASQMDYPPRKVMHMVQQWMEEEVLNCRAIWLCASCYQCQVRCPRGIDITDVMARLRAIATRQGYRESGGMTFSKTFVDIVRRYGRVFEPELLLRYHLRQDPLGLMGKGTFGLALLRRGKVSFSPDKIKGQPEVQAIFDRIEARKSGSRP